MSIFDKITKGIINDAPIITIMGEGARGKSTFASEFPLPIFLETEEGSKSLDVERLKIETWTDFKEAMRDLKTLKLPYKTVVIDSIDHLCHKFCDDIMARDGGKPMAVAHGGYGKAYELLIPEYLMPTVAAARFFAANGITTIFTCHSQIVEVEDPLTLGRYISYRPKLHKSKSVDVGAYLYECCDVWGNLTLDTTIVEKNDSVRAKTSEKRSLQTHASPEATCKSRRKLQSPLPMNIGNMYKSFITQWNNAVPSTPAKAG